MVAGGEGYGYGKSTVMVAWNVLERGCKGGWEVLIVAKRALVVGEMCS